MSIINGAQTVRSLLAATRRPGQGQYEPVSSDKVMMRLMSFKYPSEVSFVGEVTRFNNTQNALKIADFRSNDEVQKDMARRFSHLNLMGRDYEYKNKRSAKKRNSIAVTLEELTRRCMRSDSVPMTWREGQLSCLTLRQTAYTPRSLSNPTAGSRIHVQPHSGNFFRLRSRQEPFGAAAKGTAFRKESDASSSGRKGLIYFAVGS